MWHKFQRKEWNNTQAIFKLVVTKNLLKLKDKYLQMETTLWVLNNIYIKKFPSLTNIIEKLIIIKGKKSIRDNKLISHQWKELEQQNVHGTFSFGLPRCGSTGCQMLKYH